MQLEGLLAEMLVVSLPTDFWFLQTVRKVVFQLLEILISDRLEFDRKWLGQFYMLSFPLTGGLVAACHAVRAGLVSEKSLV